MTATAEAPVKKVNPNAPTEETVLSVHHYTDRLFKFTITRPASFRFRSGEFIMIGLMGEFFTRKHASLSWSARR